MQRLFLLISVAILVIVVHSQNCSWSTWSDWATCSDICGSCGNQTRSRSCTNQTTACSCSGNTTQLQTCNDDVCVYPRQSCCFGAPASLQGQFKCSLNATV